jgi:hypothetical protein
MRERSGLVHLRHFLFLFLSIIKALEHEQGTLFEPKGPFNSQCKGSIKASFAF